MDLKAILDELFYKEGNPKSIKLRKVSFAMVGKKFDEIRLAQAQNNLNKAKNNLVETQLTRSEMRNGDGDTILARRSKAVAKLEEKVTFLNTLEEPEENFVKARAIKLASNMKDNLDLNMYGLFSILNNKKEEIFNDQPQIDDVEEEQEKLNKKIENIQQATDDNKVENDNFENVTVEDAKQLIDNSFSQEKENNDSSLSENIVADIINNEFKESDNHTSTISPIESIMPKEVGKILPVTGMNVDVFNRNEEKEENIKDENRIVPIVVPEKTDYLQKTKDDLKKLDNLYDDLDNTDENDKEKQTELHNEIYEVESEIMENKDKLTEEEKINLENSYNYEEEYENEDSKEEMSFDYSDATVDDMKKAVDQVKSTKDLNAMLDKINMLKKEEEKTKERVDRAIAEEREKDRIYNETMNKMIEFSNALEDKCNKNLDEENQSINRRKQTEDAINSMLEAMKSENKNNSQKKK